MRAVSGAVSEAVGREIHERVCRGVVLYRERAQEIVWLGNPRSDEETAIIPSGSRREGAYVVKLSAQGDRCQCEDFLYRGGELGVCKHLTAAVISSAKRSRRTRAERVQDEYLTELTLRLLSSKDPTEAEKRDLYCRVVGYRFSPPWLLAAVGASVAAVASSSPAFDGRAA